MSARAAVRSPLLTWFRDAGAEERFRRRVLGRRVAVLSPRDDGWRGIAPLYAEAVAMAASGLPFQIAAGGRYDRSGDARRLRPALARGDTVFLPQIHQVLPRLMRLIVALRATFLGPLREECSFLFAAEGRGREGMGLHHDGEADQFWLQLEGRRTVTLGRPVPAETPEDRPVSDLRHGRWRTLRLPPGSLLYLPPQTPHRVICHERSLAVSLTWQALDPRLALAALLDAAGGRELTGRRRARSGRSTPARYAALVRALLRRAGAAPERPGAMRRAHAQGMARWEVVSGRVDAIPPEVPDRLWTQVPAALVAEGGQHLLLTGDGDELSLPPSAVPVGAHLGYMPSVTPGFLRREAAQVLIDRGILSSRDLPARIVPVEPAALDGWRFA